MTFDRVYLGLGSNLGRKRENLEAAAAELARLPETRLLAVARPIETEPVGGPSGQDMYLNAACAVRTGLPPLEFLGAIQRIEQRLGRDRSPESVRWGPRTIDIDILLWGERIISLPGLTVPHPRLAERRFALAPLAELAPEARHPLLRLTVGELLARSQ